MYQIYHPKQSLHQKNHVANLSTQSHEQLIQPHKWNIIVIQQQSPQEMLQMENQPPQTQTQHFSLGGYDNVECGKNQHYSIGGAEME